MQGDPLSMPVYAFTTLPLIRSNHSHSKEILNSAGYPYDSSAQGRFEYLLWWWIRLNNERPFYEYHSEGSKSCFIVSSRDQKRLNKSFAIMEPKL